ncbi:MAG TPA: hypothetical protein VFQ27_08235 [Xanthobacteraceae bacterium]|nr:hypothetical protein [Xanthobacteraceae bacterium]
MRREVWKEFGAAAIALGLLAAPALAQGQGGTRPDSSAENPSTKSGSPMERDRDMRGMDMRGNTGSMQGAPNTGVSPGGSETGSGGGGSMGQGTSPGQPLSDPRANPETPVTPR